MVMGVRVLVLVVRVLGLGVVVVVAWARMDVRGRRRIKRRTVVVVTLADHRTWGTAVPIQRPIFVVFPRPARRRVTSRALVGPSRTTVVAVAATGGGDGTTATVGMRRVGMQPWRIVAV